MTTNSTYCRELFDRYPDPSWLQLPKSQKPYCYVPNTKLNVDILRECSLAYVGPLVFNAWPGVVEVNNVTTTITSDCLITAELHYVTTVEAELCLYKTMVGSWPSRWYENITSPGDLTGSNATLAPMIACFKGSTGKVHVGKLLFITFGAMVAVSILGCL